MSDLDDLLKKQRETAKYAASMVDEKDPEKILEMAATMQKRVGELAKMAKALEARYTPQGPSGPETTVVLTKDQRARIEEQTGVGLETVTLYDTKQHKWSKDMPVIEPREVEKMAAKEAARLRLISETRTRVEKIIKELEALNVPELKEPLDELRKDPTLGRGKK